MKGSFRIVFLIQLILIGYGFFHIIKSPNTTVFSDFYDGSKNYFTIASYIDNEQRSLWHFGQMNFPNGEYVYYTDNTPAFSIPLKIVSKLFPALKNYAIGIFNLAMIFGLLLTTFFGYHLFRLYEVRGIQLVMASVCLPWLNPQIMRLYNGHMNLSQSWMIVAVLFLVLYYLKKGHKPWALACLVMILLVSGFTHIYYLFIGIVTAFALNGLYTLQTTIKRRSLSVKQIAPMMVALIVVVGQMLWINYSDGFLPLREAAAGYDYEEWKLHVSSLFTANDYTIIPFFINSSDAPHYETFAYLGSFACYGLLLSFIWMIVCRKFDKPHPSITSISLLGTALLLMIISLGNSINLIYHDQLTIGWNRFSFDIPLSASVSNYLSPFYYLIKCLPDLSHLRCLTRFSWPAFWIVNLLLFVFIYNRVQPQQHKWFRYCSMILLLLMAVDTGSTLHFMHSNVALPNPFHSSGMGDEVNFISDNVDWEKYDALLTIPFYHTGSSAMNYTINPVNDHYCTQSFQLSLLSKLPLVNSKMSRTPVKFAVEKFSLFDKDSSTESALTSVLVAVQHDYLLSDTLKHGPEIDLFKRKEKEFVEMLNEPFLSFSGWEVYELSINTEGSKLYKVN